ncbi:MAG: 3' terminal RNA ribose 2'-O-methyltransferase Hen1 [Roseiflexaceae bacterium]
MLLTITTTHQPATDLGYLLAKNPARPQSFALPFGRAHVVYPEASAERCTAALLLDIDPVGLVRGRGEGAGLLDQYVNDRPYVASSFLSVAIADIFGSALNGRSRERPELAAAAIPLEAHLPAVPARGGSEVVRRLFEPLGYALEITEHPLDPQFPEWGTSRLVALTLRGTLRLADLLSHLYVLIPVLDANKHYYFGEDEIEKLLRRGAGWLADHPERDLIAGRYLRRRPLVRAALARLIADETPAGEDEEAGAPPAPEPAQSLHEQRLAAVLEQLRRSGARSVADLGCGEGRLLRLLLPERQFERILGMDVAYRSLEIARERLRLDRLPPALAQRLTLIQGSLLYRDARLAGYDAAAVVEVIEHLDPARLAAFERVVFVYARPATVVLTTPNAEYNVRFPTLAAGRFRHSDHRFEWTRAEFLGWAGRVAAAHGYQVEVAPVGPDDAEVGAPSQLARFWR